jgi:hypothetical protein
MNLFETDKPKVSKTTVWDAFNSWRANKTVIVVQKPTTYVSVNPEGFKRTRVIGFRSEGFGEGN